ncbi:AAA family ATPase [Actinoplanes derwentensis]|uniref:AAA domain-containing protein n=1 Tax=Actinoplanes derwentensis TaxID=113562 RepID=A0A1H2DBK3_9ACTN|nr:AAA family ATPase [Actinoplanes derwentensis]GID88522.1 ATP-binding protein [Actinoplanes derwentensis]SDT79967.1 AAA domain-containing protein [Actinoplanes derwentensis]
MYIKEIKLENVRGFHGSRRVSLDLTRPDGSLAGWTVIAGRNGSGKTSLLRAVALALGGQSAAHALVNDFTAWVSVGSAFGSAVVELIRDTDVDKFVDVGHESSETFRLGLGWKLPRTSPAEPGDLMPLIGRMHFDGQEFHADDRIVDVEIAGPWNQNSVGWFCAAYGPFRRLAGGSADAQRLAATRGPAARMTSLFREDASLAEGVTWLIEQHLRALEGRPGAEELKRGTLEVLGDGLLPDGYRIREVNSEGLWVENDGRRFPLREMSDGYRTVAALVVDLLKQLHETYGSVSFKREGGSISVADPGVVLIDEVDAHLHVSWQKRIGGWLKQHFPQIQFIVTTHSPYICQAADEHGLISLPGPGEDERPRIIGTEQYQRIIYGSGDDAIMSDLFGLDTPYSATALRLRQELAVLETDVLIGRADAAGIRRYEDLRDRLSSSPAAHAEELAARIIVDRERPRP